MLAFAATVCGAPRALIAGIVIEGHTDDLGGEALNLRLSQERSLQVLVRGLEAIQASDPAANACFGHLASASEHRADRALSRRVIFKVLLRPGAARS